MENSERLVVLPLAMGSFDYVRLSPHFAQDDRFFSSFVDAMGRQWSNSTKGINSGGNA
jgi:hypothetical protein